MKLFKINSPTKWIMRTPYHNDSIVEGLPATKGTFNHSYFFFATKGLQPFYLYNERTHFTNTKFVIEYFSLAQKKQSICYLSKGAF